jgi:putative hemolysin
VIPAVAGGGGGVDLPVGIAIAVSVILLTFSFLFSGTETALFSLQKLQRQRLESSGDAGTQVTRLLSRRGALITTILIGNETVNVTFANTGARLFEDMTPYAWLNPWLSILVVTPILVLFSEITPKVLAYRFNSQWARAAVWPLTVFHVLVAPVRWVVSLIVGALSRAAGVTATPQDDSIGEAELLRLLDQGERAGSVEVHEREMIEAVFEFEELTVGRLKTPRPDMFALPLQTPWEAIVAACRERGYSRIPIYHRDPDDIVGILLLKDVLKHRKNPPAGPRQLRALLLPPVFVPRSKPAQDMLQSFLEKRFHSAFVVNEHGTLVGLITLDDLLSELFGDFPDLDDDTEVGIQTLGPGVWAVDANVDLEDLADAIELELPAGEYHTLAGFVFHQLGRLPHRGDAFTFRGHRFVVRRMDGRRIEEVLVRAGPGSATLAPVGDA